MSKQFIGDAEKTNYSESDIRRYAEYDFVVGMRCCDGLNFFDGPNLYTLADSREIPAIWTYGLGSNSSAEISVSKHLDRFPHSGRIIGVVNTINEDMSFNISILGSETLNFRSGGKRCPLYLQGVTRGDTVGEGESMRYQFPNMMTWRFGQISPTHGQCDGNGASELNSGWIDLDQSFDYTPSWEDRNYTGIPYFYANCCEVAGSSVPSSGTVTLTSNPQTSVRMGVGLGYTPYFYCDDDFGRMGHEIYEGYSGNLFDAMYSMTRFYFGLFSNNSNYYPTDSMNVRIPWTARVGDSQDSYAFQWKPYNLILTENVQEAQEYLRSGRIPSDAWIYPWNPDEFPLYNVTFPEDEDDDDDDDDEGDDSRPSKNLPDMDPETPLLTPTAITNNNLYWLQAGELASFIYWFWNDAGTILDTGDLWDHLKGLYEDLASAVINIRFMPVDKSWIGGTSSTNAIIVGQIQKPGNVEIINKANPIVRSLGTVSVSEIKKNFSDYSPYTELHLYLPFHGYMALDNDILENDSLTIKCVYDIMSGTVQYMIFVDGAMINTCIAKMAVDLPITLQSKSDRDSAIFNNVANVTGNLIGAGAAFGTSIATKSAAGVTMSTMQGIDALLGGRQTAPMKAYGSVGETGAFYTHGYPVLFIKHGVPKYPSLYGARFGYPCNKSLQLRQLKGFCKVANPTIDFQGNKVSGTNNKMRPMLSEIEEIYSQLEKGVII